MRRASAFLLCAAACTRVSAPPPPPAPAAVEPASTYVGREQPVLLRGDGFVPAAVQRLGGGSDIAVDSGFRAFLGDVELQQVHWIDSHTISAVVPSDLPAGVYGLSLQGPFGSGTADAVFSAVAAMPASLASAVTAPARALVGSDVTVSVTVTNTGGMSALAVMAGTATVGDPSTSLQAPTDNVDLAPGASHVFHWHAQSSAAGVLNLTLPFSGTDELDQSTVTTQAPASVEIVPSAHLTVSGSSAPQSQPAGPTFPLSVQVTNDGGADALAVHFDPLSGSSIVDVISTPAPQDIPAGATRTFTWVVRGNDEGTAVLGTAGAATDSVGGVTVTLPAVQWTVIIFKAVALLYPTLTLPPGAIPGESFTVTLKLDNPGIVDALGVQVAMAVSGSGGVTAGTGPPAGPVNVPAGQSATFTWTYTANTAGTAQFDATATGTDARSGNPVNAAASGSTSIGDAAPVAVDPFGDGARFAYLFSYANRLYAGPSLDGSTATRMSFDGTSAETVRFGFKTDFGNIKNAVSPTPPVFPTLGAAGCTPDTLACGPDNEDGRGLFTAFTLSGKEWLFAAGARQTSVLKHVYFTTDTTTTPQFPFVGLNLPGGTRATTAAAALGTSVYVGFANSGGSGSPLMVRFSGFPADSSQPLNPSTSTLSLPNWFNSTRTGLIDSTLVYGGSLYAANDGGCGRYSGTLPWTQCTPAASAWTAKASVGTSKSSDFIPADKAVPQMAQSGNRVYLARNTTTGPQLWVCNPSSNACDTGNWQLVANTTGDQQLSQVNDPTLSFISMLVITSQHLYVGYDSPSGIRVFRSADPTPTQSGDFSSVGATGLGAGLTQIVDAAGLTVGGKEFLYFSARPPSGPLRLYRMAR